MQECEVSAGTKTRGQEGLCCPCTLPWSLLPLHPPIDQSSKLVPGNIRSLLCLQLRLCPGSHAASLAALHPPAPSSVVLRPPRFVSLRPQPSLNLRPPRTCHLAAVASLAICSTNSFPNLDLSSLRSADSSGTSLPGTQ